MYIFNELINSCWAQFRGEFIDMDTLFQQGAQAQINAQEDFLKEQKQSTKSDIKWMGEAETITNTKFLENKTQETD